MKRILLTLAEKPYRLLVMKTSCRQILYSIAVTAVLVGCAADLQPHIYIPLEFDRTRIDYNKPLKDRSEVIICFNKLKTTPQNIANMAALECSRFNKDAKLNRQEAKFCPLVTPIAARYWCVSKTSQ